MSLNGKVAIITGGTKGIGAAAAKLFVAQGASVAINYSSDSKAANSLVDELGGESKALAIQADAGSLEGVKKIVERTVARFQKIDILIPNAGVLPMKDLMSTTEADFDKTFNLNVKGPYFLVQQAVPYMPKDGTGSVILISTSLTRNSTIAPSYLLYNSTKGAIEQMVRCMSRSLAAQGGVRVNAIAPGPTATELFLRGKPEQLINSIKATSPMNRLGEPDEIASSMLFLAGSDSRWVVGQTIYVNGAGVV